MFTVPIDWPTVLKPNWLVWSTGQCSLDEQTINGLIISFLPSNTYSTMKSRHFAPYLSTNTFLFNVYGSPFIYFLLIPTLVSLLKWMINIMQLLLCYSCYMEWLKKDVILTRWVVQLDILVNAQILAKFKHALMRSFLNWSAGKFSFTWFAPTPRVTLTAPELTRDVLSNKFWHFQKQKVGRLGGCCNWNGKLWRWKRGQV